MNCYLSSYTDSCQSFPRLLHC